MTKNRLTEKNSVDVRKDQFMMRDLGLIFMGCLLAIATANDAEAQQVAVQGGRIITVSGAEIEDGVILIDGGRITAVGKDLEIPLEAMVIDAAGKVVMPGYVEAHTQSGLDRPNESVPVSPFLSSADAINPVDPFFESALREGVTSIHVIPGDDAVVTGLGWVVKPLGMTVDDMTVFPSSALKISVSGRSGNDMAQMAELREAFRQVDVHLEKLAETKFVEKKKRDEGKEEVAYDPKEAVEKGRALIRDEDIDARYFNLVKVSRGELPVFLYCAGARHVAPGIEFAKERGFLSTTTFLLGPECFKAVDKIAETGRPVILRGSPIFKDMDRVTLEEEKTFVPKVFQDKGITFALERDERSSIGTLWYQAALAVREGMSRESALRSVTLDAAVAIGLGDQLGSIEPGKMANLVTLSGDPLSATTWVEQVLIEGKVVYNKSEDRRLKRLIDGVESLSAKRAEKASSDEGKEAISEETTEESESKEAGNAEGGNEGEGDPTRRRRGGRRGGFPPQGGGGDSGQGNGGGDSSYSANG